MFSVGSILGQPDDSQELFPSEFSFIQDFSSAPWDSDDFSIAVAIFVSEARTFISELGGPVRIRILYRGI